MHNKLLCIATMPSLNLTSTGIETCFQGAVVAWLNGDLAATGSVLIVGQSRHGGRSGLRKVLMQVSTPRLVCDWMPTPPCRNEDEKKHSTTAFLHRCIVNRFPITSNFAVNGLRSSQRSHRQPGFERRRPALSVITLRAPSLIPYSPPATCLLLVFSTFVSASIVASVPERPALVVCSSTPP
jgi:hypothetical protein